MLADWPHHHQYPWVAESETGHSHHSEIPDRRAVKEVAWEGKRNQTEHRLTRTWRWLFLLLLPALKMMLCSPVLLRHHPHQQHQEEAVRWQHAWNQGLVSLARTAHFGANKSARNETLIVANRREKHNSSSKYRVKPKSKPKQEKTAGTFSCSNSRLLLSCSAFFFLLECGKLQSSEEM